MDLLTPPGVAAPCGIAADTIRRLCISLILAEQRDLIAKGHMPRDAALPLHDPGRTRAERDALRIDEDGLGFDSLARLGLILRVNRFFNLSTSGVEDYLLLHRTLGDWVALIGQHFEMVKGRASFTFDTSGSAGPVKHITHPAHVLQAEVAGHLAGPLAYLSGARVLSLIPPHHIYGFLFSCLLPDRLAMPVLDLQDMGPTAVFRQARPGDLIIGTPFNWRVVGASGLRLPPNVTGLTSAGPSDQGTWDAAQTIGLARLTEIYGATETGGVGTRTAFDAPFRLLPHLIRQGQAVFDPARGAELELQDRLDWIGPEFHILGRKDDVVQVGGVNVSPAQVAAVIRAMDGVADVAIRPGPERLRAFIVPTVPDVAGLERALRDQIARALPAPARPATFSFGATLPRNPMGKLCDWPEAAQGG